MTKLYLPSHLPPSAGWGKTGERVSSDPFDADPRRVVPRQIQGPTPALRDRIGVLSHPDLHREKAVGVFVDVGGSPLFVLGLGQEWTEDLKDWAEDYAADEEKLTSERLTLAKEKRTKFKERISDQTEMALAHHKRNHRTDPLRDRRDTGKRLY